MVIRGSFGFTGTTSGIDDGGGGAAEDGAVDDAGGVYTKVLLDGAAGCV